MRRGTISRRITFGFASVILIALALGVYAWTRLTAISELSNRIATQSSPTVQLCDELEFVMKTGALRLYQHIGSETREDMARLDADIAEVGVQNGKTYELLDKLVPKEGKGRELLTKTKPTRAEYRKVREEILVISRQRTNSAAAYHLARTRFEPISDLYLSDIDALIKYSREEANDAVADIQSHVRRSMMGILAGLTLAVLVGVGVAFTIIRNTQKVLRRVAGSLHLGADEIVSTVSQLSSISQVLSEGASEQASSLEETSSFLEEMSSSTKRNAVNSCKANDLAKQARSSAEKGSFDMQAMTTAMGGLKSSSDDAAKIIKTIDEIAFQTNILALNAAVEAARAGEAGLSFAVVAEEVRNLAQRSAQAARETSSKIQGTITKTTQGVDISQKVADSLSEIVSRARDVDQLVSEVTGASKEQSQGLDQINVAILQIDKVTQSTAASAEEGASAAQKLDAQADALRAAVAELLTLVDGTAATQND